MPASLDDERAFKRALREATGEVSREEIVAAVDDAVTYANRNLREASPPETATADEWHVDAIAESVETYWVGGESEGNLAQGDAYVAEWTHPHADKLEVGVRPHEITGNPILVFPWYEAPDEVRAEWEPRWNDPDYWLDEPYVVLTKVDHPGIPALGYIAHGFRKALNEHFG